MIPNVSREKLLEAMEDFDNELRHTEKWSNWQQKGTYKYAIVHDGQRYPVKQIIRMATGETNFSGGYEANSYISKRGLSTVPLENENTNGLSMRDGLEEILSHYATARASEPFKGHELRQTFNGVSQAIAASNTVSGRPTLKVKASMGQGNWATIPWISLLDTRETNTTQHGVYCVYLFREDMSGVYLALAQGVTEPKEQYGNITQARDHLRTRAEDLRGYCEDLTQHEFALDNSLDLHTDAGLGTDYEASTIAHKFYAAGSVPEDSALVDDLVALLSAYDRYLESPPGLEMVLSWIRNLRTQVSPDNRFHYKPLLLLALLDMLDVNPEHPNSFKYEELLAMFMKLATERGSKAIEDQFAQPYLRMRNDTSPLQVWVPQVASTEQLDDSRSDQPNYVRTHAPSVRVADSVWPAFASTDAREVIRQAINARWPSKRQQKMVWLFQANPRYFNLEQELESVRPGDEDGWTAKRFREDMRAGDIAILWQGGKNGGIYALGELTGEPYVHSYEEGEVPAWVTSTNVGPSGQVTEWRVPYRYTKVLVHPLYKSVLLEHPTLRNMQVIRAPMGANFRVSAKEWELLQELIGNGDNDRLDRGPLNVILYGPPGTGKTYSVQRRALEIIDLTSANLPDDKVGELYRRLMSQGRIEFLTFHPSYSYEEFVEGYRYDVEAQIPTLHDGVFKTLVNRAVNPRQGPALAEGARIWKVSLGRPSEPEILKRCIENNEIGVGWLGDHDLTDSDREAIKELFGEYEGGDKATNSINSVDYLVNEIREGDYVAVFLNRRKIQAIGVVTGEYQYKGEEHNGFPHTRPVEWLDLRVHDIYEMNGSTNLTRTTVYPLDRISLQDFVELLPEYHKTEEPYVLVIDEINRGNISRIFGELITLLEPDKRRGTQNEMSVRLPYSQQHFTVPSNLYVIGTMNTADRSIALIDVALRRRFEFEELMPSVKVLRDILSTKSKEDAGAELSTDRINLVCHLLEVLNRRITVRLDRDHQIGHSYFLDATSMERLHQALYGRVFPLLQEYFYNDWDSLRLVLGEYDAGAKNKGFVASLEDEYDNVFGEDAPSYGAPSEFHRYDPDELEEILRNTFGSP